MHAVIIAFGLVLLEAEYYSVTVRVQSTVCWTPFCTLACVMR
jgi:hypothetical protein